MKCEICHKTDAQTAITRGEGDGAEELYVCHACAKAERQRRQKKSLCTRKMTGLPPGMSMSITEFSSGEEEGDKGHEDGPPPFFGAIMGALHDMVSDLEKAKKELGRESRKKRDKMSELPLAGLARPYRVCGRMHLEGLHLIGELEAVRRAVHALGCEIVGIDSDGILETGHAYAFRYGCSRERAARIVDAIVASERSARVRLFEELPRVLGDSVCRALAIMKNCRLLSPGELFDLLSPLRLAALERMLDGKKLADIERMMGGVDLSGAEDGIGQNERDRIDAERADEMNKCFEDVVLNERGEEKFQ